LLVLAVVLLAAVGFKYFSRSPDVSQSPDVLNNNVESEPQSEALNDSSGGEQSVPRTVVVESTISPDWREYRNTVRGFSLRYPPTLAVKEHDEGDSTYTIVFEDAAGEKSFQIFFTPYMGETITQSRLLKDVPSGKFTKPVEIVIGGNTHALAFFSTGFLGEMREVWFLSGGFLYEVTTYANLDTWLPPILATWRFE